MKQFKIYDEFFGGCETVSSLEPLTKSLIDGLVDKDEKEKYTQLFEKGMTNSEMKEFITGFDLIVNEEEVEEVVFFVRVTNGLWDEIKEVSSLYAKTQQEAEKLVMSLVNSMWMVLPHMKELA